MPSRALHFVPDPLAPDRQVLSITLEPGDCPAIGGDGERTERAELVEDRAVMLPIETDAWYAISLYLPADFPVVDRRLVIGQWIQPSWDPRVHVTRSPLVANRFRAGVFSITRQDGSTRVAAFEESRDIRGRWIRLAYHLRFALDSGGRLEAWMDGRQVVRYRGPLGYPDAQAHAYFRIGLYRDHLPMPMTLLVRDFCRGARREDVDPPIDETS